jgi:hypothetical protein
MRLPAFPAHSRSTAASVALIVTSSVGISSVLAPSAFAATTTAKSGAATKAAAKTGGDAKTAGFCAQLKLSQQSISAIPAGASNRFARVATEWTKLEGLAPGTIKPSVTTIRTAYQKAAKQPAAEATATLSATATAAGTVTDFATKNCPAGTGARGQGDRGNGAEGGARFAELQACLEKQGVALPRPGEGGGAGGTPSSVDDKTRKALEACGFTPGQGGAGAGGGRGGVGRLLNDPKMVECLKKAGVTITPPAEGQRPQLDDKARAAFETCRTELGLGGPGRPTTTVKS